MLFKFKMFHIDVEFVKERVFSMLFVCFRKAYMCSISILSIYVLYIYSHICALFKIFNEPAFDFTKIYFNLTTQTTFPI